MLSNCQYVGGVLNIFVNNRENHTSYILCIAPGYILMSSAHDRPCCCLFPSVPTLLFFKFLNDLLLLLSGSSSCFTLNICIYTQLSCVEYTPRA